MGPQQDLTGIISGIARIKQGITRITSPRIIPGTAGSQSGITPGSLKTGGTSTPGSPTAQDISTPGSTLDHSQVTDTPRQPRDLPRIPPWDHSPDPGLFHFTGFPNPRESSPTEPQRPRTPTSVWGVIWTLPPTRSLKTTFAVPKTEIFFLFFFLYNPLEMDHFKEKVFSRLSPQHFWGAGAITVTRESCNKLNQTKQLRLINFPGVSH